MTRRSFHSKILGVTAKNEDGYSRQRLIKRLRVGTVLKLVRDPGNRNDPYAIEVCTRNGKMLGYLNRNLAEEISPQIDSGSHIVCVVSDLTGGGWFFKRSLGVNIELTV